MRFRLIIFVVQDSSRLRCQFVNRSNVLDVTVDGHVYKIEGMLKHWHIRVLL